MKKMITQRTLPEVSVTEPLSSHPVLDRIYRSRGITNKADLERDLTGLLPYSSLSMIERACERLAHAIQTQQSIVIIGDFDADGATSTAIAVRALRMLGAQKVSYLVPNRFKFGYGLTPAIVDLAAEQQANLIITVDNGISSHAGVERAIEKQIDVIITDHHLAGDSLPAAYAIVNPNQPDDQFPSKNLAGCGVIFYCMLALRAKLRELNWFEQQDMTVPNLADLLDIVALGTVADVVTLDKNNRILVHQGLRRIRAGKCAAGIKAILELAQRDLTKIVAADLGFSIAPRLNAAGRLDDMSLGIECLLTDDTYLATKLAAQLDQLNHERKQIEQEMKEQAFADLAKLNFNQQENNIPLTFCLFDPDWHQGVIGILASRLKDHWHRPVIVFALGDEGEIKGSARSIPGLHIRDVLQQIDVKHPELIKKFGGHAMAAGLTILRKDFKAFQQAWVQAVTEQLQTADLQNCIVCDGELNQNDFTLEFAELLREAGPWGQHFPEPVFTNRLRIVEQRLVGERHLKLKFILANQYIDGIYFNIDLAQWPNPRCDYVQAAYRLDINEFRGRRSLQLLVDYLEA